MPLNVYLERSARQHVREPWCWIGRHRAVPGEWWVHLPWCSILVEWWPSDRGTQVPVDAAPRHGAG